MSTWLYKDQVTVLDTSLGNSITTINESLSAIRTEIANICATASTKEEDLHDQLTVLNSSLDSSLIAAINNAADASNDIETRVAAVQSAKAYVDRFIQILDKADYMANNGTETADDDET